MEKDKGQYRWYLQIRFKKNTDSHFWRTWCINEPFKTLLECERMAYGLMDETVEAMRIADSAKNKVHKIFVYSEPID
jgi:hypothetical protein